MAAGALRPREVSDSGLEAIVTRDDVLAALLLRRRTSCGGVFLVDLLVALENATHCFGFRGLRFFTFFFSQLRRLSPKKTSTSICFETGLVRAHHMDNVLALEVSVHELNVNWLWIRVAVLFSNADHAVDGAVIIVHLQTLLTVVVARSTGLEHGSKVVALGAVKQDASTFGREDLGRHKTLA